MCATVSDFKPTLGNDPYLLTCSIKARLAGGWPPRSAPRVLTIKSRWLKLILEGKKTWEIRNKDLQQLGPVHLSPSGTTDIVATCDIRCCVRLTPGIFYENMAKHCLSSFSEVKFKTPYAWVLTNIKRVAPPLVYKHKPGAVIFNRLR